MNRVEKKIRVHTQSKNKGKRLKDNNTMSNTRRTYITVPYSKGLSESFKNTCKKYGIQVTLEGARPSKTSWWHLKTEITSPKRVASFIGISVTGWNMIKSI